MYSYTKWGDCPIAKLNFLKTIIIMGGNAMTNAGIKVSRKSSDEYFQIKKTITDFMLKHDIKTYYAREMPEKVDYGDLDVLYVKRAGFDMRKFVIEHFKPIAIESNGGCLSFTITTGLIAPDFQIDFVGIRECELESELFYRSYGDMGNIIGRITSYYGIKFGSQGLWVDYEFQTASGKTANHEIMLTNEPEKICQFLGLDYSLYQPGFTKELHMFEWIKSCKWFCTEAFGILNVEYRHRIKKRPGYVRFMEFLDIVEIKHADSESLCVVQARWRQDEAIKYFKKESERQRVIDDRNLLETRQSKFNGQHFISLGFTKGDIGRNIREFKTHIAGEDDTAWNAWLDSQPDFSAVAVHVQQFVNHAS